MMRNREIQILICAFSIVAFAACYVCYKINTLTGLLCGIAFFLVGAIFFVFTRSRYKKISELSDYIRNMADGRQGFDIRDNVEGELSILKNDIFKLNMRLSEQAESLRKEKAALRDVLFDISHQLKTPLTSLSVMADLLAEDGLPPDKRREFTNNLHTGLSRMEWLVLSLLKMARLDANADELKTEEASVYRLIEQAINSVCVITDIKNQKLIVECDKTLKLKCDINWTIEAIANILKNAAEYTPDGGEITVCIGENPVCAWISVTDSGGGIDPGDLPHLFKRFYKGKKSTKSGFGIGLSLSFSIMQKQNGDIEVKSITGKGSSFILKFYKSIV